MSQEQQYRKELLKLSKSQLIKKCKSVHIKISGTNPTKSDMITSLIKLIKQKKKDCKWTTLMPLNCADNVCFILINDNKIIGAPYIQSEYDCICEYNFKFDRWQRKISYPLNFKSVNNVLRFNKNRNELYISTMAGTFFINLAQNEFINVPIGCAILSSSIFINDICHIFGGAFIKAKHSTFDFHSKKRENIFSFIGYHGWIKPNCVYIQDIQTIFLFGGRVNNDNKMTKDIWSYLINDNQWTKLSVSLPIPICEFGYCYIKETNNILIFGGCNNNNQYINDIFIWNLDTMIIKKSKIQIPIKIKSQIFATIIATKIKSQLIVAGYLRQFLSKYVSNRVPTDVIEILKAYYQYQEIHLLSNKHHLAINAQEFY